MEYMTLQYLIWAVALGCISAVSLPLGSWVGIQARPRPQIISTLAAFGAGALIAALTVELVSPTLFALEAPGGATHHGDPLRNFFALVIGAAAGGIIFIALDMMLNARGGFLRRTSSTMAYLTARKRDRQLGILEDLAGFPLLRDLPPEHINTLIEIIQPVHYEAGETVTSEGEPARELFFLVQGSILAQTREGLQSRFGAGTVIGVIPIFANRPHLATGKCEEVTRGYALSKANFERLCELSPVFSSAIRWSADQCMAAGFQ